MSDGSQEDPPKGRVTPHVFTGIQIAFILLAAFAVFTFVTALREGELRRRCGPICALHPNYAGADRKVPAFHLRDLDGKEVDMSSFQGKVVVLNLWTITCGPCMEEMPAIAELTQILKDRKDVVVLTISTDEGRDGVRETLKVALKGDPPFKVLFDPDLNVVREKFGTKLFPETFIIDKHGTVRARFDGAREWNSSLVVDFVDQLRADGYCPVTVREGKAVGEGAHVCEGS